MNKAFSNPQRWRYIAIFNQYIANLMQAWAPLPSLAKKFFSTKYFLLQLFTDVMFLRPILKTVRLQAATNRTSPTFLYRFAFDGALGLFKRMLGISHPGACHGDEMGYLFYFSRLNYRLDDDSTELAVSRRMVQMWTNFAKYGLVCEIAPSLHQKLLYNWN